MAIKTFTGIINNKYQGGTGATTAKAKANKQTLKMFFTIDSELKGLANNIKIDSAKLYLTCGGSGKSSNKQFTFSAGLSGAITSTGEAYNNTCYLNIGDGYGLRAFLANGGGNIWTYDNSSTYHSFNSSSGYYTENYCSVSSAKLEIQYTILQSTLTNYPSTIVIGNSKSYTISASDSSYTHKLSITFGGTTFTLLDGKVEGTYSYTPPTSWAQKFTTTSSTTATLTLETKNGSTSLGTNTYSNIAVKVDGTSGVNPVATIKTISTSDGSYAIAGSTKIYVDISGTAKENASIKSYTLRAGGFSYTYTEPGSKTITVPTSGDFAFYLDVVDSRGLTNTYTSQARHITNYIAPSLKTGTQPFQRVDANGNASIQGRYYSFTYQSVSCCTIYNFDTNAVISNPYSVSITINGVESKLTGTTWRSTTQYPVDQSYTATVKVSDLRTTVTYTFDAPSASYLIHFLEQKNSVGIGCAAEVLANGETGKITMGWPVYMKGNAKVTGNLTVSGSLSLSSALPIKSGGTGATTVASAQKQLEIINLVYPVGSIYISISSTNPGTLFGIGTWVAWGSGRVPVGIDTSQTEFSTVEKKDGYKTHTLTVNEMPSHSHKPANWNTITSSETKGIYNTHFATIIDIGSDMTARERFTPSSTSSRPYTFSSAEMKGANCVAETTAEGGGNAFSTMPPYITCYMWKRTA